MASFYQRLIHARYFPVLLGVLVGGYAVGIINMLMVGHLPIIDQIEHNRYPLLDPASNLIDQSDYIVNLTPLKNYLDSVDAKLGPNKLSVYIETLNSGSNLSVNKDLRVWPASLAKLPLAMAIMNKVEDGNMRLAEMITITPDDIDGRSGTLYQTLPGTAYSVDQLLTALLEESDNTAQHALLRQITPADMQDLIDHTGLDQLADPSGKISSKEYTKFLRALYTSSYLSHDDSEKLLSLLAKATFRDFLSQGVPDSITFCHKYGEDLDNKIFIDSGIVYLPNRPYMITVMVQGTDRDTAKSVMNSISAVTYQYFDKFTDRPPLLQLN